MGGNSGESYRLTNPGGATTYDLASWMRFEEGPDFGDAWMSAHYAENPAADGGQFAYENIGVRTMTFPILVPIAARPGAFLDIQLANVATSDAIRFDVLGGRYKPDYRLREQQISIRRGTLELDVQPFGYLPTNILLASVASLGLPGMATVPGGQIVGDVPGLGLIEIINDVPVGTNYPAGTWRVDFLAWSLGGGASYRAFWGAGSTLTGDSVTFGTASLAGDAFAPASQGRQIVASQNLAAWKNAVRIDLTAALEPAYRSRFRFYTWAKLGPSQSLPWYVSGDVAAYTNQALASSAPIATLAPAVASGPSTIGAYGAQPSPAYTLLDLGEVTIPAVPSGATSTPLIRVWVSPATSNVGVATTTLTFGGIYLQRLDGAAGVIPRGIVVPTTNATTYQVPNVTIDANTRTALVGPPGNAVSADLAAHYRGNFPFVGASAQRLDLLIGERYIGPLAATGPIVRSFNEALTADHLAVSYRPRFAFVRGL